jgi:hypothetical protein
MNDKEQIELTLKVNDQATKALESVAGLFSQTRTLANSLVGATENLNGTFGKAANVAARFVSAGANIAEITVRSYTAIKKVNDAMVALSVVKGKLIDLTKGRNAAEKISLSTEKIRIVTTKKRTVATITQTVATKTQTVATKTQTVATKAQTLADSAQKLAEDARTASTLKGAVALKIKYVAMKVAAVAAKLLGKAMTFALGPIGLLIAGAVALTAAIIGVFKWFRRSREATTKNGESIGTLAEKYNRSTEEISSDMERMGTKCLDVWEETQQAVDRFAEEFGRCADEIREEIFEMADQYETLEEATEAWEEQENAIRSLADKFGMSTDDIRADMQRMGITCTKVWSRQESGIRDLADRWGKCANEIRSEVDALAERYGDHEKALQVWGEQRQLLEDVANKWNVCTDSILSDLDEMGYSFECQTVAIQFWESKQYEALQGVADEWGMSTDEILAQMAEQGINAEQWSAQMGEAWDNFNSEVSRNVDGIVNGFRAIPTEFGQSSEDLRKIMDGNITATETWRENLAEIAGQVPDDMLQWLESKGPEFNSVIEEMLNTDGELEAWRDTFARSTELAREQALDNIDDPALRNAIIHKLEDAGEAAESSDALPVAMEKAVEKGRKAAVAAAESGGEETGTAYVDGVTAALASVDFTPVVNDMDRATSQMAVDTTKAMAIIKSVTSEAMTYVKDSVYSNMSQTETNAENGLTRITAMFNGLRTSLPVSLFDAGYRAMEGMRLGMMAKEPAIIETARRIAQNVVRVIKSVLRIESPSRVLMRLGDDTMKGFAIGMERMQDRVKRVVNDTAYMVKDGLDKALAQSNLSKDMTLTVAPPDNIHQNTLMERLIDAVEAGKNIIMDSGELVGATYPHIDNAAGHAIAYNNRWGR